MGQPVSPLIGGLALMGMGLVWLCLVALVKAGWGDERKAIKYGLFLPGQFEFQAQFRPVFVGIALWVFRPIAWTMLVGGLCTSLYGVFEKFQVWVQS
ncbi:hypothetical protein [Mesorhizobium prunaredense]|uniref:hypothetical protein n=1 Tax=Mesorhizobium prunaredense TaxID=1631249 RepID=UPI001AECE9C0|nr:hypothetical protein [Mesorhizobium prunaredense]